MADRNVPGEDTVSRLLNRNGTGLHRKSMPDGGEVYTGPMATRALRTLGARAFTMDGTVFASQDFDPSGNAEHAALYAHERFHQSHSGGDDGHGGERDQEEVQARAIERMVFHRASSGENVSSILREVEQGGAKAAQDAEGDDPDKELVSKAVIGGDKDRDPMEGYKAMLQEGKKDHYIVVNELRDYVIQSLLEQEESHTFRTTDYDFFG